MADAHDYEREIAERLARLRDIASVEIHGLVEELLARTDQDRQRALEAAMEERDAAFAQALEAAAAESAEETNAVISAALAEVAEGGPRALLAAVRRLDEETNLSGVLDTLVNVAAGEAGRAALFVGVGESLHGWRFVGFDAAASDPMDPAAGGVDPGLVDRAISERCAAVDPDRGALAVPVVVGGQSMALLYVDGGRTDAEEAGEASGRRTPHWTAAVEILARYTGCRLESLTANRVADLAAGIARED